MPPSAPLRIQTVEYEHPTLIVTAVRSPSFAQGWHRDGVVAEWASQPPRAQFGTCAASTCLEVQFSTPSDPGDCSFHLSGGSSLDTQWDRSGYDTWTFKHNDLGVVFRRTVM